jgi:hypothetical protein
MAQFRRNPKSHTTCNQLVVDEEKEFLEVILTQSRCNSGVIAKVPCLAESVVQSAGEKKLGCGLRPLKSEKPPRSPRGLAPAK